jgi:hypothetical protein
MKNLKDVTFIIPIRLDSEDRLTNYNIIINHLTNLFDTNIIVFESDEISHEDKLKIHDSIEYVFEKNGEPLFHRTRILNLMTKMSKTDIICNYDTDVVFMEQQYINAINKVKNGHTLVFPYDGKFMNVLKPFFNSIKENKFENLFEKDMELANPNSFGGAFFFDKKKYFEAGLENENFVSWGFEDNERVVRLNKLGYNISRVPGMLYHLEHERTMNSAPNHSNYNKNMMEYNKIHNLPIEQLRNYVKTWKWIK